MKSKFKTLTCGALAACMLLSSTPAFAAEVTTPGGSADSDVTLTVGDTAPKIFFVTVPAEIPVNITKDGIVEVADNLNIRNDSSDAVKVTSINVNGKNGWDVCEYAADFSAKPDNSKVIAMAFRGDGTDNVGNIALTPDNWDIDVSTNLDIDAQVKLTKQTKESSKANIATVHWSFDWKDADSGIPDTSAITHNWEDGTPMLVGSTKDVTFDWSSTADTNSIVSVESSSPNVATIEPAGASARITGQSTYTVTGVAVGTTTITATLNSGETTSFDVTVNEVEPGTGGDGSENPSDGLDMTIDEATAMGFTFSAFEDGLQIDSFENKQFKKEINVPEQIGDFKVLKVGDNVFNGQSNLTKITLPNTVTSVGASAFSGCSSLTAVNIPTGVTRIEDKTFDGCTALTLTNIPPTVTYIGNKAFYDCQSLNISVDSGNMTKIGEYAFYNCSNLGDVIISTAVETGVNAFSKAGSEDATLTIKGTVGVKSTDMQSPYYISEFGTIVISDEISTLKWYMFQGANAMKIVCAGNLQTIPPYAFCDMTKLVNVVIPESVVNIQKYAFYGCSGVQNISIPSSVTSIGPGAFQDVTHIEYHGSATGAPWGAKSMN